MRIIEKKAAESNIFCSFAIREVFDEDSTYMFLTRDTDVLGNKGDVLGNKGDVSENKGDVSGNKGDVSENKGDVSGNVSTGSGIVAKSCVLRLNVNPICSFNYFCQ